MDSNPSLIRAGLPIASQGHTLIGTFVNVIDANGSVATGYLEHYDPVLDVFDVVYARRKAEVSVTTDKSASGRFGDFGGDKVEALLWERKSACYVTDSRFGVERFILAGEDPQILIDHVNAGNAPPPPEPKVDLGQDAGAQGTNAGGTPAPEPTGKVTAPAHPDIAQGAVEEPEPDVIPIDQQKGALPDGFPGLAALDRAGITTFKRLKKVKDFTSINGIGEPTAAKIKAALGL